MAYADDPTILVERNELERLLAFLDCFSKGTQFKVTKDKCEIIADFEIANWTTKRTSNVLGVGVGDETEAKEITLQRSYDLIMKSKNYFNKFMNLRGLAKTSIVFVIPKLLHFIQQLRILVTCQKFCQAVLWGPGGKADVILQHLERSLEKGELLCPISCHVLAAKICDIENILHKKDGSL